MKNNDFRDIEHEPLRIYNQCVYAFNLLEDGGRAYMEDYLNGFSRQERLRMAEMYKLVLSLGPKVVKEMVTDGLAFSDEDYVLPAPEQDVPELENKHVSGSF